MQKVPSPFHATLHTRISQCGDFPINFSDRHIKKPCLPLHPIEVSSDLRTVLGGEIIFVWGKKGNEFFFFTFSLSYCVNLEHSNVYM